MGKKDFGFNVRGIVQGVGNKRTGTGMEDVTRCVMGIVSGLMDGPCGLRSFLFPSPCIYCDYISFLWPSRR